MASAASPGDGGSAKFSTSIRQCFHVETCKGLNLFRCCFRPVCLLNPLGRLLENNVLLVEGSKLVTAFCSPICFPLKLLFCLWRRVSNGFLALIVWVEDQVIENCASPGTSPKCSFQHSAIVNDGSCSFSDSTAKKDLCTFVSRIFRQSITDCLFHKEIVLSRWRPKLLFPYSLKLTKSSKCRSVEVSVKSTSFPNDKFSFT